jgi:hypothetical protein
METESQKNQLLWRVVICAALVIMIFVRLPNLGNPLLDHHDFRQTQTAISAYWLAHEHFDPFNYQTPLFGEPWTIPFEFPLYQVVVAGLHKGGLPLDIASRGVSVLVFSAVVIGFVYLLRRMSLASSMIAGFVLICGLSPFAIVWSRASLIDFTSVLMGSIYLHQAITWCEGKSWKGTLAVAALGAVAGCTKITTFPVFWVPTGLLLAYSLYAYYKNALRQEGQYAKKIVVLVAKVGCILGIPLLFVYIWTKHTDVLKTQSVVAPAWLVSGKMSGWNFGSWSQRVTSANWLLIWGRIRDLMLPGIWPFTLLGALALFWYPLRTRLILGGIIIGSISGVCVFFNLYVRHDYYLCSVMIPLALLGAMGFDLICRSRSELMWKLMAILMLTSILGVYTAKSPYVLASYADYRNNEFMVACQAIQRVVQPQEVIVVFGDDWSSRIPYYCERKAVMADKCTRDRLQEYVKKNKIRWVVSRGDHEKHITNVLGGVRTVFRSGPLVLLEIPRD